MKRLGLVLLGALTTVGMAHAAPATSAHSAKVEGASAGSSRAALASTQEDSRNAVLPDGLHAALAESMAQTSGSDAAGSGALVWSPQKVTASDGGSSGTFAYSVAISGNTALIGVQIRNAVYVFTESDGIWSETQKLTAQGSQPSSSFGTAVALDGKRAAIAAYTPITGDVPLRNAVYVFDEQDDGTWTQSAELLPQAEPSLARFGKSVAVSGNTVLVGAYEATLDPYKPKQGAAYVFSESAGSWSLTQTLSADDGRANEYFGMSVALEGDTALIGARNATIDRDVPHQGAAYVFEQSHGTWTQTQKLVASDGGGFDYFFGSSVALSGNTALVGAPNVSGNGQWQGAAYVFDRSGDGWIPTQKLVSRNGQGSDQFGISVALSGSTALVGAYGRRIGDYYQQGEAFVFTEADGLWTQTHSFRADSAPIPSWVHYGWAVALDGPTALVGAHLATVDGISAQGAAWFYTAHRAPTADLSANSLHFRLEPGTAGTKTLEITNVGDEALDYTINESAGMPSIALAPAHATVVDAATAQPSPVIGNSGIRGARNALAWQTQPYGDDLAFALDDGSYEDSITFNHGHDEAAAVWLNQFQVPPGTGSFTLDSIAITWPQNDDGTLVGRQVNLLAYYDAHRIGDPSRAVRLGADHFVTIDDLDVSIEYPVDFSVPGDGDIYIGFENSYARGDSWPQLYPAALDTDFPQGRSWLVGRDEGDPDLDQLANNNYLGILESFGMPGNWLIRATGRDAANDCLQLDDVPWLSVTPTQGTIAVDARHAISVAADTSQLPLGGYSALLCILTNDPAQGLIRVPVRLDVAWDETIFRDGFDTVP